MSDPKEPQTQTTSKPRTRVSTKSSAASPGWSARWSCSSCLLLGGFAWYSTTADFQHRVGKQVVERARGPPPAARWSSARIKFDLWHLSHRGRPPRHPRARRPRRSTLPRRRPHPGPHQNHQLPPAHHRDRPGFAHRSLTAKSRISPASTSSSTRTAKPTSPFPSTQRPQHRAAPGHPPRPQGP